MTPDTVDLPDEWREALDRLARFRRIVVIGAADAGKSSFIRALIARSDRLSLIDLDPGQKMVGPPGTLSVGVAAEEGLRLQRFRFLGSTSPSNIFQLTRGAAAVAGAAEPFVANTSGLVAGFGARLQSATISALRADALVAIGPAEPLAPIVARHCALPLFSLQPSPLARSKTAAMRRRVRQAACAEALDGAAEIELRGIAFEPARPVPAGDPHPVCALADEEPMEIAVLLGVEEDRVRLFARTPPRVARRILLGHMWADTGAEGWKLLDRLSPSWEQG
jgi:polynucleotide 5'-hydroxyl-kinase GRC3/NOL9